MQKADLQTDASLMLVNLLSMQFIFDFRVWLYLILQDMPLKIYAERYSLRNRPIRVLRLLSKPNISDLFGSPHPSSDNPLPPSVSSKNAEYVSVLRKRLLRRRSKWKVCQYTVI
jgi:hypothetical protein